MEIFWISMVSFPVNKIYDGILLKSYVIGSDKGQIQAKFPEFFFAEMFCRNGSLHQSRFGMYIIGSPFVFLGALWFVHFVHVITLKWLSEITSTLAEILYHRFITWLHLGHTELFSIHYTDPIMGTMASQITSLTIVYSTVYSDADQRKYQSSTSLAFVWGIHHRPVNSHTNGQ